MFNSAASNEPLAWLKSQQSAGKSEWEKGRGSLKMGSLSVVSLLTSAWLLSEVISYIDKILQTQLKTEARRYSGNVCLLCLLMGAALLGVLGAFDKHVEPSGSVLLALRRLSPSLAAGLSLQAP